MGEGQGRACLRNQKMSLEKEPVPKRTSSLSDLEQNLGVQTPSIPLLSAANHEAHWPAVPGRGWQQTAAPYFPAQVKSTCTDYYCITPECTILIFAFCNSSEKILQAFRGPLTHNTVKNIVQAATKVSSSKSRKTWNKNQQGDGKPYGLCTCVTPRSFDSSRTISQQPCLIQHNSINSGQVASSWT